MDRMRRMPLLAALAATAALLAGCGSARAAVGPVQLPEDPVCPPRYVSAGEPQPVAGLTIGAVVLCDDGRRSTDEYVELRYTSGIEEAVAALAGSGGGEADADGWCEGPELIADLEVVVVTTEGRVVVPELPVDACGSTNTAVEQLYALRDRDPDSSLVVQPSDPAQELADRTEQARAAGCPATLRDVLPALEGASARADLPVLPASDGPQVRGCLMEVLDLATPTLGFLFGGGSAVLDVDRLQRGLDHVGPLDPCPTTRPAGLVTAWLVDGRPLFFTRTGDECSILWTPEGVVGSLDEDGVSAFS